MKTKVFAIIPFRSHTYKAGFAVVEMTCSGLG